MESNCPSYTPAFQPHGNGMGCCNSTANVPPSGQVPGGIQMNPASITRSVPMSTQDPHVLESSSTVPMVQPRSRPQSTNSTHSTNGPSIHTRMESAPQQASSMEPPSFQALRNKTNVLGVPSTSRGSSPGPRSSSPVGIRALVSSIHQVTQVLSGHTHTKFRILVVGKRGSGKSALINAVFKVDTSAVTRNINEEIYRDDNRYLIVHEYSAFGPGDGQNLQTIRDFISNRTDQARLPTEELHAVWICVPASDAMIGTLGSIGEGIEDILNMRRVPTIVAFTKFDQVVALEGGSSVRINAHARFEQSCRSLFRKEPKDVPAEMVSVRPQFSDLIDSLVMTTDRFMTGSRTPSGPSARSSAQGAKPRTAAGPLVWSAALRVNRDIFIQASIEVGRSRYWRDLRFSLYFADQPLKECVNVIHTDIVEIWNLNDKTRYLSNSEFKAKMSHVVKDLAGSVRSVSASPDFAEWVYDVYRGSQENVQCVMGYIVDLTVILDGIFSIAASSVSRNDVQTAMNNHTNLNSGRRDVIHADIRSFVKQTFAMRLTMSSKKDMVLEKIDDLIRLYCVSHRRRL